MVVSAVDTDQHIDCLDIVFRRLREHGLKVEGSKYRLFSETVPFLSHIISSQGVGEKARVT